MCVACDFRYATEDNMALKRQSYSRSQRFSRHRNRDRLRQERHTVERERVDDRSPKRFAHNTFCFRSFRLNDDDLFYLTTVTKEIY